MTLRIPLLPLVAALALLGSGCSKSGSTDPSDGDGGGGNLTNADLVDRAWELYDQGEYQDARAEFDKALRRDSTYTPAVSGQGWADIELGFTGLAQREFEAALAESTTYVPALCGRAVTSHAEALNVPPRAGERLAITVESAGRAIQIAGEGWRFDRIPDISSRHMRALLALAYFELRDYGAAQDQLDVLDSGNNLDPGNPDYVRLLLQAIENLRGKR